MSRSFRAALVVAAALITRPGLAFAQESQPFTNTSDEGLRVVPADDARGPGVPVALRADGDFASGKIQMLPASGAGVPASRTLSATQMRGRLAASYAPAENVTVFGSLFSAVTSYSGLDLTAERQANAISQYTNKNPLTNYGDVVTGARYSAAATDSLYWGAEGGLYFYGQANGVLSGPALAATSPFARGLVTWANDSVHVTGNLGASYDQSWKIWEEAFKASSCTPSTTSHCLASPTDGSTTAGTARTVDAIDPEERFMLGIYGKSGPVLRVLGGGLASFDLGMAHPFVEASFEMNGGPMGAHFSPGIAFAPEGLPHVILAADIAPIAQKATDAAPGTLAAGFHAALVYDFGGPHRSGHSGGSRPHHAPLVVEVVNDKGDPMPGVKVTVREANQTTHMLSGTSEGDGKIHEPDLSPSQIASVRAERSDIVSYPMNVQPGSTSIRALAIARSSTAPVSIQFLDERGAELRNAPIRVEVMWGRAQPNPLKWNRPVQSGNYVDNVPATPDQGWRVIATQTAANVEAHFDITQPTVPVNKRLYWDSAANRWSETPPPIPVVGTLLPNVFDADLAEVKPGALNLVADRLTQNANQKAVFYLTLKAGSDPVFADILLKSRADAIAQFLKNKNVREGQWSFQMTKGPEDSVRVDIK